MAMEPMKFGQPQLKTSDSEDQRKIAAVYGIASLYGSQIDRNALKLWVKVLQPYSAEQVEEAAERLVSSEELVKMPAPAVLIRHIKEIASQRHWEAYRREKERREKFEKEKNELKAKYRSKFNRLYDLCFSKAIDGNEYKKRHDALVIESRKALDKLEEEQKAGMLELSYGKK